MQQVWYGVGAAVQVALVLGCVLAVAAAAVGARVARRRGTRRDVRRLAVVALATEVLAVLAVTLSPSRIGQGRWNLVPLAALTHGLPPEIVTANLAGNVLMFVPFGLLLPTCAARARTPARTLLAAAGLSGVVEVLQQLPAVGRAFDVDDVLFNALGGLAGYGLWRAAAGLVRLADRSRGRVSR